VGPPPGVGSRSHAGEAARDLGGGRASGGRPILLATLDVPFDERAVAFAVDSAVETGQPLLVVNVAEVLLAPWALLGWGYVERDELQDDLRRPAELARSLTVPVERVRLLSPHPIDALVDIAAERRPSVLVFGPDQSLLRRRTYRRATKRILDRVACLVWLPD
jgi:nucleotide-binding universal stress UspA family protein